MKIAIFTILLTLGLANILWNTNKKKPEPIAPSEVVSEQMIKQDIHTERHHQLIAPHHTEPQKTSEITVKGSVVNSK